MVPHRPLTENGQTILKRGLNDLHRALADWILMNPGGTLRQMGTAFGYSPAWLCQVVNTDMFKAYMADRRVEVNSVIASDLPTRLQAAAFLATERMIEVIEKTDDAPTLIDAFDKVLHRYGYAPNAKNGAQAQAGPIGTQNNVFFLDKSQFQEVKERLVGSHATATEEAIPSYPLGAPDLVPST